MGTGCDGERIGSILVVDAGNRRLVLLDHALRFIKEILSTGSRIPRSACLDERTGLLYVADNEWNLVKRELRHGLIHVYNVIY
jgi:glucose/arabinose dehydrogenase